jgi:predicted amidohydrolase YtcJ
MTTQSLSWVNVFEVPDKVIALERVAERVHQTAPGAWIRGAGWTQDAWSDPVFPTAADLDGIAPQITR